MKTLRYVIAAALLLLPVVCGAEDPKADQAAKPKEAAEAAPTAKPVIGYIDARRIAVESAAGKKARDELTRKNDALQAQVSSREKQLEKQKKSLEAQAAKLAPEQRTKKIKEYEKKVEGFREFLKKAEKELSSKEEELGAAMIQKIRAVAKGYGEKNGLSAIVAYNDLVYAGNVELKDITADIMKALDEAGAP